MQKTKMFCNNFSGINRTSARFSDSIISASDMQNVELFSTGANSGVGIRSMKGNIAICEKIPSDEIVVNIFQSVQKFQNYFFVHTESQKEGKLYLLKDGDLISKFCNLEVTGKSCACDVTQGWSDLCIFSNGETLLSIELGKLDESGNLDEVHVMNLSDTEGRQVKGLGLVVFSGRLWIFNNEVLWYSAQENIYDFSSSDLEIATSAGYIEFVKKITAISPYLGTLAVFYSNSSCLIVPDEDNSGFSKSFDSPGGCAGYNSIVFHGTQLYFYDDTKKGVFCFSQVVNGDKTLGENIAINIQKELFSIPSDNVGHIRAQSVLTSDKNEIWFLLPTNNSEYSTIMIFDYLRNCWIKRKSQKITSFSMINGALYSAGKKIYKEYSSFLFDEEFIESFYMATPLNFGVENSIKIFSYPPKVTLDMTYRNKFWVEYIKNYNSLTSKSHQIISRGLSDVLYFDVGNWDKNLYPHQKLNVIKKLPYSYFKTLQINFHAKSAGENFCIKNIEFGKIKIKN